MGGVGLPFTPGLPNAPAISKGMNMPFPGSSGQAGPAVAHDPRAKIRNILKDRLNFETNLDIIAVKRYVAEPLKFCVEETGMPPAEASTISSKDCVR